MSDLRPILEAPWLILAGWTVVLSVWCTTMPALALAAWRVMRPRSTARLQYRAAVLSLGAALALSLAMPVVLLVMAAPRQPTPTMSVLPASTPPAGGPASRLVAAATSPSPRRVDSTDTAPRWLASSMPVVGLGLLGAAWLVGVAVCLVRLLGGWIVASRVRAGAALVDEGPIRDTFDGVKVQARVEHAQLAVSLSVDAPVVIGVTSPTVVLPAHLLDHLPPDSLAPILAHEIAHVARRDYAANLVQCAAEALLFHSPATWWLGLRIREAREFSCDDRAVALARDCARYVEALTLVARLGALTGPHPVLGMAGPRLITRVRRLLQGEPRMNAPVFRTAAIVTCGLLLAAALPLSFSAAAAQLSTRVFAAGRAQEVGRVPIGFPQRQEGTALRIRRVDSTGTHVCGTFEVENVADVAVTRVRLVGILSFKPGANRPVQIVESDWFDTAIAPGATVRIDAALIDIATARREAAGEHVQALCALREVVHANRVAWSGTPNPAATTDRDAMGFRWPSLPRVLVGQTSAIAEPRVTLCMDEAGDEYSPGAQIAIRSEPGKAARCTRDGQWMEVDPRTGDPIAASGTSAVQDAVVMELRVAGLPATVSLKGSVGATAAMQLPSGQTWGFVPTRTDAGAVNVALHDLSTRPHRLVGTRRLGPGETVTFDVQPTLSLRLTGQ